MTLGSYWLSLAVLFSKCNLGSHRFVDRALKGRGEASRKALHRPVDLGRR
jgi:hypothetical protein